jgi:hypothetical protein
MMGAGMGSFQPGKVQPGQIQAATPQQGIEAFQSGQPITAGTHHLEGANTPGAGTTVSPWEDLLAEHDAGWADKESMAQAQGALEKRRSAEMAAGLGAAASGGTSAMAQAQAGLLGQQHMMEAKGKHDQQRTEMRLAWLQQMYDQAEREKDRDQMEKLQNMINTTQMNMMAMSSGGIPSAPGGDRPSGSAGMNIPPGATMTSLGDAVGSGGGGGSGGSSDGTPLTEEELNARRGGSLR